MNSRAIPRARFLTVMSFAFGLAILAMPRDAHAYLNFSVSQMAGLPPYCRSTRIWPDFDIRGSLWKHWERQFGRSWDTMHHYCAGQILMREARRFAPSSPEYRSALNNAISEFNFLLRRPDSQLIGFPLWAEMLSWRGQAAVMVGDWRLAVDSYEKARTVQPNYWPAYLDWADALIRLKVLHEARDVLQSGLRIDPSVQALRRAYSKIGGSLREFPIENDAPVKPTTASSQPASESDGAMVTPNSAAPSSASAASR